MKKQYITPGTQTIQLNPMTALLSSTPGLFGIIVNGKLSFGGKTIDADQSW